MFICINVIESNSLYYIYESVNHGNERLLPRPDSPCEAKAVGL